MQQENQPIVVNLPEGQNTLTFLHGNAPKQLDILPPEKTLIAGTIEAPLEFLRKRVEDINQHKAHILVNRNELYIMLIFNEDDAYNRGQVSGVMKLSKVFQQFGINSEKQWVPEQLGQFLKLNRTYFTNREDNMKVVNALKTFNAKVNQTVERETKENGNRAFSYRQAVDSNIPDKFNLRIQVISGGNPVEIEVETYASIDGNQVSIALQSPGANDVIEEVRNNSINSVIEEIRKIAPEIAIIEM